jgi:hypothetical protein
MIYLSRVLRLPLAAYFNVFKFCRRRFSQFTDNEQVTTVWHSIVDEWSHWYQRILKNRPVNHPVDAVRPDCTLFCDASIQGAGAVLFNNTTGEVHEMCHKWERAHTHREINELEATAVALAAERFAKFLADAKAIHVVVDNTSCKFGLKKGLSPSFDLNNALREALGNLPADADIRVGYIESANNPADRPSRGQQFSLSELSSACGLVEADWPARSSLRITVASGRWRN